MGARRPRKPPNSTLKWALSWVLPATCARFLWRQPGHFPVAAFLLGAGIGGFMSLGLFQILVNPTSLPEDQKVILMYSMAGVGALGWGLSPHIRCASLLVVPKMLGKEGRLFVLGYLLAAIYEGPVSNVRHNLAEVARSLGCTVELQVNNSREAWRVSTAPLRAVIRDLLHRAPELNAESRNVTLAFSELDEQVTSQEGYQATDEEARATRGRAGPGPPITDTQKMYELKTRLRCNQLVRESELGCGRWFSARLSRCLNALPLPLLKHLLCLPLRFDFVCAAARVMGPWCRNRIPVEGNFGQTYDSVNDSVNGLGSEFSARVEINEQQQQALVGGTVSPLLIQQEVSSQVTLGAKALGRVLGVLQVLFSATFLLVFCASFSYTNSYNGDIRFDNIYITTYFRQIDARRRRLGKGTLLPLRKAEEKIFIFPWKPTIQIPERANVIRELMESMPPLLLLLVTCVLDWALYTVFATIRHHSFLEYSYQSSHQLEVKVGGDSLLARLLRTTVGALNTSSSTRVDTDNTPCLPEPRGLDAQGYARVCLPAGLLLLCCLLQAYGYRLRRVIASFYFPKREKKRILFLYNEGLRRRLAFAKLQRKNIVRRAQRQGARRHRLPDACSRRCPGLVRLLDRWLGRSCVVCQAPETSSSLPCPTPGCGALYCPACWGDVGRRCPACTPAGQLSSSADSDSVDDTAYAG
ncbi:E3 ubiquitin-protein ligase DCST1 [Tachyglossus aculeatus]|uniref:E3 ubiquitin-protein ligase DCST1 n=1 Tax=Tachyglossus aculeatus TaxID=9261 RepID=UPI0018F2D92E|nr:E3 ubiquitin-protein ligase DCST1 [Tachyglossus aculeatus]